MKIIFLDIDGVLNYYHYLKGEENLNDCKWDTDPYPLSRKKMAILNGIIEKTGAKIVLTSVWRLHFDTVEECDAYFKGRGLKGDIIGKTDRSKQWMLRGNEIRQWIYEHIDLLEFESTLDAGRFHNYVILDDDSDMLLWQKDNFIHINGEFGLTEEDADKAIEILNK